MIDPLGTDDEDVGHFCGLCGVNWAQAEALSRLRQLTRTPFLLPCAFQVVAECLGGNRSSFRVAMKRYLLQLLLLGKPYGFKPLTLTLDVVRDETESVFDIVLDYVIGVGCGFPDFVF